MEVISDNCVYLSNHEVLDVLNQLKNNKNQKTRSQLATITYQTVRCLEETPCKHQVNDNIQHFLQAVSSYKLTKCEKLSLINLAPKSPVEIQLIVEDSEERLSEDEVDSLLEIISTYLLPPEECENQVIDNEAEAN